ncbi:MAG: hypothetical protein ACRBBN_20295 [Methyloligellaceae bacterium]
MHNIKKIVFNVVWILMLFLSSQANSSSVEIFPIKFKERWTPKSAISGVGIRVGLISFPEYNSLKRRNEAYVYLSRDFQGFICVDISSIDGVYNAQLEFPLKKYKKGNYKIVYQSNYSSHLKKQEYKNLEIAILATLRKNCDRKINFIIPASWVPFTKREPLFLLLNTNELDVELLVRSTKKKEVVNCQNIKTSIAVSYNKSCRIPFNLSASSSKIVIKRYKNKFKQKIYKGLDPVKFPLF